MPPAIPEKIPCESPRQLEQELSVLQDVLSLEENEETWERIARALTRFAAVVRGGGYKFEKELVSGVKVSAKPIISAMISERTRLSGAALDCISIIAPRIKLAFETLVPLFIPPILRLTTRTNKVYVTRSQTALTVILGYCHLPSILPHLLAACRESKIAMGRAVAADCVLRCLNKWDWTLREVIAKIGDVEEVIRITGRDKDAGVRQTSRKIFEAYKALFPERVDDFTLPLTPITKKYLGITTKPTSVKVSERARSPSARCKPKQPLKKLDLSSSVSAIPSSVSTSTQVAPSHARSISSEAVTNAISGLASTSRSGTMQDSRSMPPPASIPSRKRIPSQPEVPVHAVGDHPETQSRDVHQRQRVPSTASSTFSVKSAPSKPTSYGHQPSTRLAVSQSRSRGTSPTADVASSGRARRVRRVVEVEPHPTNRLDPLIVAHKGPVRVRVAGGTVAKPDEKPGHGAVAGSDLVKGGAGIAFPSLDEIFERKGPQRVPKVAAATNTDPLPPQRDGPQVAIKNVLSRERKPSKFRPTAPGVSAPNEKQQQPVEKSKEGFAPRRGGVLQPTLSQLGKQKAPASTTAGSGIAAKKKTNPTVGLKRAVSVTKVKTTGVDPATQGRVRVRSGVTSIPRVPPVPKQGNQVNKRTVNPAMIPLPASPGREKESAPKVMSTTESSPEISVTSGGHTYVEGTVDSRESSENVTAGRNPHDGQHDSGHVNVEDIFVAETVPRTQTPPFPQVDEESDRSELEAIEFTAGSAYTPAGVLIKTPRKVVGHARAGVSPERNPLTEVVINE